LLRIGSILTPKKNYHGPTYFYFGAFSSIIYGKICKLLHCVGGLSIFSIRLVPAIFGTLICLSPLLLCEELGLLATLAVALLLAISPANVFYSRYAIHETLFVFFYLFSVLSFYQYFFQKKNQANFSCGAFLSPMRQRPRKPFSSKGQFFFMAFVLAFLANRDGWKTTWKTSDLRSIGDILPLLFL